MPIANVSEIVGRRDLVAEAQGWADLYLKKQKQENELAKAAEAKKPKPYNFDIASFGTKNENMLALQEDLNDQAYDFAMANSDVLAIDPRSEDCGPDCQNAHRTLHNMQSAADIFNTYGDDLKTRYDELSENIRTDPDNYDNAENRQKLEDMKNVWEQGMGGENYNFTFGPDGRLVVNTKSRNKTQKIKTDASGAIVNDANGNPVKLYDDGRGGETDDPSKARKDKDGNPMPIMVDMDTGQETDFKNSQTGFGDWLTNLGFSDRVTNANSSNFQRTSGDYAKLVYTDNEGNYDPYIDKSYEALEAYIFGNGGYWDDNSGTGQTNGHSNYLKHLVNEDKMATNDTSPITKAELVQKAYELGRANREGDSYSPSSKTTKDSEYDTPFVSSTISGSDFNQPINYDSDNNYNQSATQNPDYETDVYDSNYTFEGQTLDTAESGYINLNVQVNPKNVSLITGDNRFSQVENDNQLASYLDNASFQSRELGLSLFYKGKAISDENFQKLEPEEQKKCSYERALYGEILLPSRDEDKLLKMGIIKEGSYKTTKDGNYISLQAIVGADKYYGRIAGTGATKGESGTLNQEMLNDAKTLRKTKNLQLQCSLDPNYSKDCKGISQSSPASNQSSSSIDTSKYNK
jgi:hypothetical protein